MKKNRMLGSCPVCKHEMTITEVTCDYCKTKISGSFEVSKFDQLSHEDREFALVFIKNEGNIKKIEEDLGISYPTVKNKLKKLKASLGYKEQKKEIDKTEILSKVSSKELTPEEAIKLLK